MATREALIIEAGELFRFYYGLERQKCYTSAAARRHAP